MVKKKILLMGASGSGKTSMRALIFSTHPSSLTMRWSPTIEVDQNHVRFFGDLILNLWDCGGQDSYMDGYLATQQATVFQHVGVLIYVFDVQTPHLDKDLEYYQRCLAALRTYSPGAAVFLLVHKMDLVSDPREKRKTLERKTQELKEASGDAEVTVFGTTIHDESLYKAWSRIVHTLIPNAGVLSKHLTTLGYACSATEVILFERTTFLVIATSSPTPTTVAPVSASTSPAPNPLNDLQTPTTTSGVSLPTTEHESVEPDANPHQLSPTRYERTSELIKGFKLSCSRVREEFQSLEVELADFTAVLDELTKNTYVLIVVHDPTIETAALRMNIRLARKKFEELQGDSLIS
ncbi:uncharacterized protein LAESUDRAFT_810727 [Laetiporus sulphureus 93-53]|uniref:GTP-binding protein n=1 Tax=Laetiporus sulphureus 93-53 TaxID=1314785 RepID=A0A165G395_9APHY|nr:uncharacterized protein LAESUDRAFT_810727 [Laetiporus sulphureus 93-53]KZT09769.1 hypothetical protein LAESUDRAFT_810727 [Laetiporus sulphureus 93-53]